MAYFDQNYWSSVTTVAETVFGMGYAALSFQQFRSKLASPCYLNDTIFSALRMATSHEDVWLKSLGLNVRLR